MDALMDMLRRRRASLRSRGPVPYGGDFTDCAVARHVVMNGQEDRYSGLE